MTEKEIRKYIDLLNNKKGQEYIFIRPISDTVELSKVWAEKPKETDSIVGNFSSSNFFFIKNSSGIYVGAVFDMYSDLHWYISPKHRKKGYLTKALLNSILPHIFSKLRDSQRITIQKSIGTRNYNSSKSVALKLGFEATNEDETEFELQQSAFNWERENQIENTKKLGKDRIDVLRKRANYASKVLLKISDELQMAYNDDDDLYEVSNEVKNYTWKIENLMWENEEESEH